MNDQPIRLRCPGENARYLCRRREQCQCYTNHLADCDMPTLPMTYDLGWGKVYERYITDGCCEYVNNLKLNQEV